MTSKKQQANGSHTEGQEYCQNTISECLENASDIVDCFQLGKMATNAKRAILGGS